MNSNIQKSPSFKNEENDEFNEKPNNHNVKQKKINEGFKNPNGGDDKKSSNNLLDVLNSQSDSSVTNSLESPKKVKIIIIYYIFLFNLIFIYLIG